MRKAFLLSAILITSLFVNAQGWERFYDNQRAETFCMTADNEFVLPGIRWENMMAYMEILRTDTMGYAEYDTIFFYPSSWINFVLPTADSGYLLSGSEGLMMRFDKNNHIIWQNQFDDFHPNAATEIAGNGFIVAGFYGNNNNHEAFVMEINNTGDSIWSNTDLGYDFGSFYQILPASDGGYFLTSEMSMGKVLLKTDQDFSVIWIEDFDYINSYEPVISPNGDDGVFVGGTTHTGLGDVTLLRINNDGVLIWLYEFVNEDYNRNYCRSVSADYDGGMVAAISLEDSDSNLHPWILKLGEQGDSTWSVLRPDVFLDISKIVNTPDSMYVFHGVEPDGRSRLVKMDPADGSIITGIKPHMLLNPQKLNAYPNPFNEELRIALVTDEKGVYNIMDITGKEIMTGTFEGKEELLIQTSNLSPGIYLYKIMMEEKVFTGKVVKE